MSPETNIPVIPMSSVSKINEPPATLSAATPITSEQPVIDASEQVARQRQTHLPAGSLGFIGGRQAPQWGKHPRENSKT